MSQLPFAFCRFPGMRHGTVSCGKGWRILFGLRAPATAVQWQSDQCPEAARWAHHCVAFLSFLLGPQHLRNKRWKWIPGYSAAWWWWWWWWGYGEGIGVTTAICTDRAGAWQGSSTQGEGVLTANIQKYSWLLAIVLISCYNAERNSSSFLRRCPVHKISHDLHTETVLLLTFRSGHLSFLLPEWLPRLHFRLNAAWKYTEQTCLSPASLLSLGESIPSFCIKSAVEVL